MVLILKVGFTFHYASTLSVLTGQAFVMQTNLHSTMLLLYRAKTRCCHLIRRIYIPLCFYFIYNERGFSIGTWTFTFHYASTLSGSSQWGQKIFTQYLHSTMLLLYRNKQLKHRKKGEEFTFHYASTLSGYSHTRQRLLLSFTFHYASTLS